MEEKAGKSARRASTGFSHARFDYYLRVQVKYAGTRINTYDYVRLKSRRCLSGGGCAIYLAVSNEAAITCLHAEDVFVTRFPIERLSNPQHPRAGIQREIGFLSCQIKPARPFAWKCRIHNLNNAYRRIGTHRT